MGATNIHYKAPTKRFKSAREAFNALCEEEIYNYGHDPYSGTIATCSLVGEAKTPIDNEDYDELLDRLGKRDCVWYEKDGFYNFVGWASC